MNPRDEWADILPAEWMLSKTFRYLAIRDLRSLRATSTGLKTAVDSFVDTLSGHFQAMIGARAFSVLASYLSINDLCILNTVSSGCRFSMRAYSITLPREVRALLSTWCEKNPSALLMCSFECFQQDRPGFVLFHPPFLTISLGPVTFDRGSMKLKGQPLEEVQVNNAPPPNLGRITPFVCSTADSGSEIFYCGGASYVEGHHDGQWILPTNLNFAWSSTTALFNTATGLWRQLPQMPEPRMGGRTCRVGRKVLIIGGIEPELTVFGFNFGNENHEEFVLVFDLDQERWLTHHGIQYVPGEQNECDAAVALDSENAIIVTGKRVYSLNVTNGKWTELPALPILQIGKISSCQIIRHPTLPGPLLLAVGKKTWAVLLLSGEYVQGLQWAVEPDLRVFDLPKMVRFHRNRIQVFSGNSWELMESVDITSQLFYQGRIIGGSTGSLAIGLAGISLR